MVTASLFYLAVAVGIFVGSLVLVLLYSAVCAAVQEYRTDRVPALLYHQLIPRGRPHMARLTEQYRSYVVYHDAFAEQMAYLDQEGYTPISIDDFISYQAGRKVLPEKPILLTFDDGFASNHRYAFPILKHYGMTATIFATPDSQCENFKKHAATDAPLTHAQMREMNADGILIQSHGMTHRYLTELEPDVIRWELTESKKTLEAVVAKPVEFLAIPSGAYNRTVRRLAKEAGYRAVFCMLKGTNNKKSDPYALRRLVIGRDITLPSFRRILEPSTASYLRLTSAVQGVLHVVLGPRELDRLRDRLYRSRIASVLKPAQLSYVLCGISGIMFLTVAYVFIWFLWRYV